MESFVSTAVGEALESKREMNKTTGGHPGGRVKLFHNKLMHLISL